MGKRLFIGQRRRILLFHHALVTENNLYPFTFLSTRFIGKNTSLSCLLKAFCKKGAVVGQRIVTKRRKRNLGFVFLLCIACRKERVLDIMGGKEKQGKNSSSVAQKRILWMCEKKHYCLYYACCLLLTFVSFWAFRFILSILSLRGVCRFLHLFGLFFESMPRSVLSSFSSPSSFSTLISQLVSFPREKNRRCWCWRKVDRD